MSPTGSLEALREDLLWSEVLSSVLDEPLAPSPSTKGGQPVPASSPSQRSTGTRAATAPTQVSEWSRPLVVEHSFCRHQHRQYTVHVAADLLKGESFGRLRRRGYGFKLHKQRKRGLPAASSQFGFPGMELTSRSNCADVARRRNLAPTLERFPVLKTSGVRPPLPDLEEIDAADAAAAWSNPQKPKVQQQVQEHRFRLDRPWVAGNPQPRLFERQVGGLCEPEDENYFALDSFPSKASKVAPVRARSAAGAPRKSASAQQQSKEPEKIEKKSLKSKLKEAFMKQMNDQKDVMDGVASEATRSRRRSSDGGMRFHVGASTGDDSEEAHKTGLWRIHHKESQSSRL